jgi:DNA-binding HxlR family transcriptional regulator
MLPNDYANQNCAIAGTLELIGERWTLLVIRDAFVGVRRFDDFQRSLGVARNVLQTRLTKLVDAGILRRERYQQRPDRYEYRLTARGVDLWPILVSLMHWGNSHLFEGAEPVILEHRDCGGRVDEHRMCTSCGAALNAWDVQPRLGPAALPEQDRPGAPVRAA